MLVIFFAAVFPVAEKRMTGIGKLSADLMCSPCDQTAFDQRKTVLGNESPIKGDGSFSTRYRFVIDLNLCFVFVFENEVFQLSLGG